MKGDMDLSVLPNNNHPDKFLQLDVKSLMRSSTLLQASLARFPGGNYPATQHWQNLVYSQVRSKGIKIKGGGVFLSQYMTFSYSCEEGGPGGGGRGQHGGGDTKKLPVPPHPFL
jgi:hypothetical protein